MSAPVLPDELLTSAAPCSVSMLTSLRDHRGIVLGDGQRLIILTSAHPPKGIPDIAAGGYTVSATALGTVPTTAFPLALVVVDASAQAVWLGLSQEASDLVLEGFAGYVGEPCCCPDCTTGRRLH